MFLFRIDTLCLCEASAWRTEACV